MKNQFHVWHSESFNSYTITCGGNASDHQDKLEPDAKVIHAFEASSWDEAMTLYHEYMGFEPYKPFVVGLQS